MEEDACIYNQIPFAVHGKNISTVNVMSTTLTRRIVMHVLALEK